MFFRSEALPYVLPGAIAAAAAASTGHGVTGLILALLASLLVAFFRDPKRESDNPPNCVLSPADGKVVEVKSGEGGLKIAIFLSVFNVHVTRSPLAGRLIEWKRITGGYAMAFRKQASNNARHRAIIESPRGNVELSLIAGAVARRVVPFVIPPKELERGEPIALIKFGSRTELRLPAGYSAVVSVKEKVRAGETIIAEAAE
jgi:phosphatidylserine decarboxylase